MSELPFLAPLSAACGQYAFYFQHGDQAPVFTANAERFSSASMIKLPILLACAALERADQLDLGADCDLDGVPQVRGAGFARSLRARRLPLHDVLLMMISTSDNLCTNLVIQAVGMPRLNQIFTQELGLTSGSQLQRHLMDFEARCQGLDNWIAAQDCVRMFTLFSALPASQRAWVDPMLLACQDQSLLLRDLPRDALHFYHKTGSISGVLHDWGYTRDCRIFLLTNQVRDEAAVNQAFGQAGRLLLG